MRACELQRAFRDTSPSGYSLELLAGPHEGDLSASSDGEKQLLSPGGTELYEDGEDGLRVETSAPPSVMTAVCPSKVTVARRHSSSLADRYRVVGR